jgi:hypothetical protein
MSESNQNPGYEKSDVGVNKILIYGVIGIIAVVAIIIFVIDYYVATKERLIYETVLKPESKELRELRAREDAVLNSYQVIDSTAGIYQIPIDRAIQLMATEAYRERIPSEDK